MFSIAYPLNTRQQHMANLASAGPYGQSYEQASYGQSYGQSGQLRQQHGRPQRPQRPQRPHKQYRSPNKQSGFDCDGCFDKCIDKFREEEYRIRWSPPCYQSYGECDQFACNLALSYNRLMSNSCEFGCIRNGPCQVDPWPLNNV